MAITDILGTALSFGRSLLAPSRAVDVVAVLGPGFTPIFQFARPLVATVTETSLLMEHPLEDGATIADHIVFDPVTIQLPLVMVGEIEYRSTYALIRSTFKAGLLLTVVTRTGTYPNMVIEEMPHEESPASFDAIQMRLQLREANFVTPKSGGLSQTKDAKQSSTVGRGAQQTTTTTAAKSASASSAYTNSGLGPGETGSTLYRWSYGQ